MNQRPFGKSLRAHRRWHWLLLHDGTCLPPNTKAQLSAGIIGDIDASIPLRIKNCQIGGGAGGLTAAPC